MLINSFNGGKNALAMLAGKIIQIHFLLKVQIDYLYSIFTLIRQSKVI